MMGSGKKMEPRVSGEMGTTLWGYVWWGALESIVAESIVKG